jgi:hypothetical protein
MNNPVLIGDQVDADIARLRELARESLKDGGVIGVGEFLAQVATRYEIIAGAYFASWGRDKHDVEQP